MCCCYSELSQDEAFVDEICSGLRFIASVLLRRVQKASVDFAGHQLYCGFVDNCPELCYLYVSNALVAS